MMFRAVQVAVKEKMKIRDWVMRKEWVFVMLTLRMDVVYRSLKFYLPIIASSIVLIV